MARSLIVEIPDEVYEPLVTRARQIGQTPEQLVAQWLAIAVHGSAGLPGAERISPEEHAARVDAIAGKYSWVPTSVDEFIRRKQEEIDLEDRGWKPVEE